MSPFLHLRDVSPPTSSHELVQRNCHNFSALPAPRSLCGVTLDNLPKTSWRDFNPERKLDAWVHLYTTATCTICLRERLRRDTAAFEKKADKMRKMIAGLMDSQRQPLLKPAT